MNKINTDRKQVINNYPSGITVPVVCIQGLGFVGAAMATAVAIAADEHGKPIYDVVGVDLPNELGQARVDAINNGEFPFATSDDRLISALTKVNSQGNLRATTDTSVFAEANIIVVDIQLDIPYLDDEPQLQFDGFKRAIQTIGEKVQEGALIVVETTVPPGTCEKVVVPTLTAELNKRNINQDSVLVAHSYERVMPGEDYLASIIDYWRVFAGHTQKAGDSCEEFLSNVVNVADFPLTRLSSTTASETAKVMENTYRATNIAFIDEWTKYAETVGIDMFEVVDAIRKRPTHSNIRFPGLGVGGYCLTKDPTFAPAAAKQLFEKEVDFPFSKMAVQVNHNMPLHTVTRLTALLAGSLVDKKILVCGVSYRKDVGDTRYSPSETLVKALLDQGGKVSLHDPYIEHWEEMNLSLLNELPKAKDYDAVVFAVAHKLYSELELSNWGAGSKALVLDANYIFSEKQRKDARAHGIKLESIGRGDGL